MAKDSAHSRIPRLDGITRIPVPGTIRIPQKSQNSAAGKLIRPTSFSGLRPPLTSAVSLKNSFSGERLGESESMVGKKPASVVKKFLIKPEKSSSVDDPQKYSLSALERDMTYNVNKHISGGHESSNDRTRTITRSQTFIRDSIEDDVENNLLGVTHDVFPSSPTKGTHGPLNGAFADRVLLDVTQTFDNTITYDSNTKMKEDIFVDTFSCERLSDISIPSYDADTTLKPLSTCESNSYSNLVNVTTKFEDSTVLAPDRGDLKLALSSTVNNDRLLDVSEIISPSRHLMNITRDITTSPQSQHNNTNLLYISRSDLDGTVLVPHKSAQDEKMDVDESSKMEGFEISADVAHSLSSSALQGKPRFSFGLDLTECTLDCSIELCDVSLSSSAPAQVTSPSFKKQNSFEMDESLGILTPDQMKEFLDSATTTTNLDLPINMHPGTKLLLHQLRIDQTPSPEDLPLDPIGVKTDVGDIIMSAQAPVLQQVVTCTEHSQTDSDSKTDQMTKSSVSKVSTSFITSVTSITSLDTGYQGDGEMSRPASRGACDHSPSNVPRKAQLGRQPSFNQNNSQNIPIRRQDPMTDSDFFTESDADDIFHRGDRRAQVIDGQLYGPMLQPSNVFITEQPQMEDSCMESSGIFTDVEIRCDEDIVQSRLEADIDMSPDGSTDTVKSNNNSGGANEPLRSISPMSQGNSNVLSDSQTSSTIQSSLSCERISVSSVSGESLQSRRNAGPDHLVSKSSSVSGSTGALNTKSPANNDGKKAIAVQKPESSSLTQASSVKKVSPARKHHAYGGKYETKTNAIVENTKKTGISTGRDLTAERSAVLSAKTAKKSASSVTLNEACDGDMFIKSSSKRSENQENKSPGLGALAARKPAPNKWDAVMSKIAESKTHKKNYSEVKSKVSTGVLRRSTPGVSKSPTGQSQDSNCASVNSTSGLNSPQTKRALQGPTKRGRSYSKDSQLSSQSDLSLSGGSPKLQSKISPGARSAKKRDVRTLSISPTDLGPPPKTQTNITSRTKQQPTSAQKRTSQTQQTLPSPLASLKGSSPVKKVTIRRLQLQQSVSKVPLKDHNRLSSQSQQQQQGGSPKTGVNFPAKSVSIPPVNSSTPLQGGIKAGSRNYIENTRTSACSNGIGQSLFLHKQAIPEQTSNQSILDFRLSHVSKGVEALGVLLQYLVYDLEAFSCPLIKKECNKAQKDLLKTSLRLEEARAKCGELQDEIHDKEAYFLARETELQTLHRCELQRVQSSLSELEVSAKERIAALEAELVSKDADNRKKLQDYICDSQAKLIAKDREIEAAKDREQELLNQLSSLSTAENELREKVLVSENSFAERLQAASQRERELTEKINGLNKQLDALRHETESRERELEEKLHLSHDEISVLRSSRNSLDQAPSPKNGAASKVQMLQDEVESLRCVLELKQSEISDLRKHNQELGRATDELPAAQMKISALESRVEDLQIQLKAKIEEEKELIQKNKHLQESYSHEVKNRNRLSLHNEELQWRLKQNSEKFALALTEMSKSYQENAGYLSVSKASFHSQENTDFSHNSSLTSLNRSINGSDRMVGCFQMDDLSPPTSPIIKGVVEKSDSVSWVLEMDDESPEVLASRMVRRAGSFRSSFNEKSPGARRQSSLPTSNSGGNPLSQSASATSVIRQHSIESVDCPNISSTSNSRTRSKSVTIKGSENPKKLVRQSSSGNGSTSRKVDLSASWKEPICSSSPYSRKSGTRMSPKAICVPSSPTSSPRASFCAESESVVYRKPQRNLITCDTSALTSADRLRTIPTSHPSVQDFKGLKKCQEIQESAGEAMVSGTNSEDEGCSASSDETVSSASSSTSSLGGKQHLSIEDALLIEKISTSLGGTPMEVSWSDDGDHFPSESVV